MKEAYFKGFGAEPIENTGKTGTVNADKKKMVEADWTKDVTGLEDSAAGKGAGKAMKDVKTKEAEVEVDFAVAVDKLDAAQTEGAIKTKIKAADDKVKDADITGCIKFGKGTDKCGMKCTVSMKDRTDTDIDAMNEKIKTAGVTGKTTGRRSDTTGTVYASQSTTQCPAEGCGTGTAAAATAAAGAVKSTIVQTTTLTGVTASAYVGDLKLVVEIGYSIGLGIYDTTQNKYKTDCSCKSSAARRSITITFTATASADTAVAAKAAADGMTKDALNANMASAKGAVGASVTLPTATGMGEAKASTYSVSAAPATHSIGFTLLALAAAAVRMQY
jgi:hypothetical protein